MCVHICVLVCMYRPGNEAMCMDVVVCMYVYVCVCYNVLPVVLTSGDSSVVSCCFIYYHQRESAGLIL